MPDVFSRDILRFRSHASINSNRLTSADFTDFTDRKHHVIIMGALTVRCLGMLSQNAAVLSLDVDLHHRHTGARSFEKQQEGHSKKGRLAVMRWSPGRETDPRTDCEGLVSHHSSIN